MPAVGAVGGAAKATGTESHGASNDDAEINQLRRQVQLLQSGGNSPGSGGTGNASAATQFDTSHVPPPPKAHFDVASVYAAGSR